MIISTQLDTIEICYIKFSKKGMKIRTTFKTKNSSYGDPEFTFSLSVSFHRVSCAFESIFIIKFRISSDSTTMAAKNLLCFPSTKTENVSKTFNTYIFYSYNSSILEQKKVNLIHPTWIAKNANNTICVMWARDVSN